MTASPSMQIANTILEQLGGRLFTGMTGAKTLTATGNGLNFRIPSGRSEDGKRVNYVSITLNGSDLYDVAFYFMTIKALTLRAEAKGVYAEDLQSTFTTHTALHTHR